MTVSFAGLEVLVIERNTLMPGDRASVSLNYKHPGLEAFLPTLRAQEFP